MAFFGQQQPFSNPGVPFTGSIQGGLQEGKVITVSGRVLPQAQRFHVNFQCGSKQGSDIAFHFNPRYDSNPGYVVANTFKQRWGTEERKQQAPIPRGSNFILTFLVNRDFYTVTANGSHFMDFKHRLPIGHVDTIAIDGGVVVNSISFSSPQIPAQPGFAPHYAAQPGFPPQYAAQPGFPGFPQPGYPAATMFWTPGFAMAPPPYAAQQSFTMPYKSILNGGMVPGRQITIHGMVSHTAQRFSINLRFNSGIAFHFNPRVDENVVVRNSFLKEKWGNEERGGGMPFFRGQPFMVTIICKPLNYEVMVNGAQMFNYNHRHTVLQEVDILEVNGDVSLTSVLV
ncbi:galectin-9B-like isoform X2 [Megalops cyprinoides]|uniref:galectin-9B-like isoform X2 n=1 Tax=Megalops cyprinoides TaxID=118141 RepID=UPI001863A27B|nr:galectin-9B-like isoform X2 [Megalops cyprinoides]